MLYYITKKARIYLSPMKYFLVIILAFYAKFLFGQTTYINIPGDDITVPVDNIKDTVKYSLAENKGYIKVYKIPNKRTFSVQYFSKDGVENRSAFFYFKKKKVKTPDILLSKRGKARYVKSTMYVLEK